MKKYPSNPREKIHFRHRITSRSLLVTLLIFVLLLQFPQTISAKTEITTAKLQGIKDEVFVKKGGGNREFAAFENMTVTQGDWIRTGTAGTCKIVYNNGTQTVLNPKSQIVIQQLTETEQGSQTSVKLFAGGVWNKVKTMLNIDDKYELETPTAVMSVRGTLYMVTVDENGNVSVDVADGAVAAGAGNHPDGSGSTYLIGTGSSLQVGSGGQTQGRQPMNVESLVQSVDPGLLVQIVNDIIERAGQVQDETQQALNGMTDTTAAAKALQTAAKAQELANLAQQVLQTVEKSSNQQLVQNFKKELENNQQNMESLRQNINRQTQETQRMAKQVQEKAREKGLTQEEVTQLVNQVVNATVSGLGTNPNPVLAANTSSAPPPATPSASGGGGSAPVSGSSGSSQSTANLQFTDGTIDFNTQRLKLVFDQNISSAEVNQANVLEKWIPVVTLADGSQYWVGVRDHLGEWTLSLEGPVEISNNWITFTAIGMDTGTYTAKLYKGEILQETGEVSAWTLDEIHPSYGIYQENGWESVGNMSFSTQSVLQADMTVFTNESYTANYAALSTNEGLEVMMNDGSGWTLLGDRLTNQIPDDIAIGHYCGVPYVAYSVDGAGYLKKYDGDAWTDCGSFDEQGVGELSLTVFEKWELEFAKPVVYIAYRDGIDNGAIYIRKFEAGSWQSVGEQSELTGSQIDITSTYCEQNAHLYLSFVNNSNQVQILQYIDDGFDFEANWEETAASVSSGLPSAEPLESGERGRSTILGIASGLDNDGSSLYLAYLDTTGLPRIFTVWSGPDGEEFREIGQSIADTIGDAGKTIQYFSMDVWHETGMSEDLVYFAFNDPVNESTAGSLTVLQGIVSQVPYVDVYCGWFELGRDAISSGFASNIVLDAAGGIPYVCYADASMDKKTTILKFDSGARFDYTQTFPTFTWLEEGEAVSSGQGNYVRLDDFHGMPYIAYSDGILDGDSIKGKATVKSLIDGSWTDVGNPRFTAGEARQLQLCVYDDNGQPVPYIAYADMDAEGRLSIQRFEDGSWNDVGIQGGVSDARVIDLALKVTADGVFAAYVEAGAPETVVIRKYTDALGWQDLAAYTETGIYKLNPKLASLAMGVVDNVAYVSCVARWEDEAETVYEYLRLLQISEGTATDIIEERDQQIRAASGTTESTDVRISPDGDIYVAYIGRVDLDYSPQVLMLKDETFTTINSSSISSEKYNSVALDYDRNNIYLAYCQSGDQIQVDEIRKLTETNEGGSVDLYWANPLGGQNSTGASPNISVDDVIVAEIIQESYPIALNVVNGKPLIACSDTEALFHQPAVLGFVPQIDGTSPGFENYHDYSRTNYFYPSAPSTSLLTKIKLYGEELTSLTDTGTRISGPSGGLLVGWLEQYAIDGEDQFILQISPFYMDDPNGQYLVTIEYNGLTLGGFLLLASDGSS